MMKKLMALMALTALTACDYSERSDLREERSDRDYKSAMDDYRSGRIDAAIGGFRRVVGKDPANASARFQLACLLQDAKADYLGAYCGYVEYLSQHPESDEAQLAKDRMAKCELELAKSLAEKHGLADKGGLGTENAVLKEDLRKAVARAEKAEKAAASLQTRVEALSAERTRLLAVIRGDSGEATAADRGQLVKEAKDLLEEEDDVDRIALSADVSSLKAEAASELSAGSDFLPPQPATNAVKHAEKSKKPSEATPSVPETYVVQEGDTLYRIAKRFYGRLSAWKRIRDANKEQISSDGRVRVGDTLRMPRP